MASNSFGNIFKYTTWGESHGSSVGCVIDGVPSNISLDESYIQSFLDKRRPGNRPYTTTRKESDKVKILSGIFKGKTTGSPLTMIVYNEDQRSEDYTKFAHSFRPGHADYVYTKKYSVYDYRGGGRASARETVSRVIAGAVARKILGKNITMKSAIRQIGVHKVQSNDLDWSEASNNSLYCPSKKMFNIWQDYLEEIYKNGDSIGSLIEIQIHGAPLGLGEPIYKKLDASIASAIMSINAVKSVEIGCGIKSASLLGSEYIDEMYSSNDKVSFSSNNSGGILAGISTSEPIIVKFAVKPTSSIKKNLSTITVDNVETEISITGRHDVCIGIRAIPVAEAMLSCVLLDHLFLSNALKIHGS